MVVIWVKQPFKYTPPFFAAWDGSTVLLAIDVPTFLVLFLLACPSADMSDVVPPEVRPKPAVPAKPPNVGAPSPSSPFPTQGLGIGVGGGASFPPPSGIPVPIGSHGPVHISSHNVGHGVGHGTSHNAAHNGGHGHGGSHSSSGGSTLLGYIGIDTIIEQMRKKTMKTGFDFNIMVVGKSQNPVDWDECVHSL